MRVIIVQEHKGLKRPPIARRCVFKTGNLLKRQVFAEKWKAKACFACQSGARKRGMGLPKKAMSVHEAEKIAQKIALEQNVELVDVELVKEPTGHFLRFYIEKPEGISVNELETYHRRIMPLVENVEYDYMEVSSPGADRPLKKEKDFERAAGMVVELKTYRPVNGGKVFQGELIGLKDGIIEINSGDEVLAFPQKAVAIVRPLIEFTEEDLMDDAPADQQ